MKQLKLFTLLSLIFCVLPLVAQEDSETVVEDQPSSEYFDNKYYGMNENYVDFTSDQKKFKDWSLGLYGGLSFIQGSDLNTLSSLGNLWSYDLHGVINKQITHAFGLGLQFNYGKTEQQSHDYKGHTDYWTVALIGDINLSNLFRRVDNRSRFAWALHGYAGLGTLQYDAYLKDKRVPGKEKLMTSAGGFGSIFGLAGGGLRYKLNQNFDLELKTLYYFTGDEEFDGSGSHGSVADLEEGKDDGLYTLNAGVVWKIGKHHEHLSWADPLADIYPGPTAEEIQNMLVVCVQGDKDDDGVCDDWDRELNTPKGARVDGAGRALDTDLDGVIDLYDECVTIPGPAENNGCPLEEDSESLINLTISNLEFSLDSDVISPSYYPILDQAANYINYYKDHNFDVVGHTDSRASQAYNLDLSKRRAEAVVSYLVEKNGVDANRLSVVAMGKDELRFPECNPASECPEWKNHANRRVVFIKK